MSHAHIPRAAGRSAFGHDPAAYDAARPDYPEWLYDVLRTRCGLAPGAAVFEIGPGTGTATRRALEAGLASLTAIEPDPRLAGFLSRSNPGSALEVVEATFEAAMLKLGAYDLGLCATAFHWLEEDAALNKIVGLLRPGGWWAAFWNVFGDSSRPDPFHDATHELLAGPLSPSGGADGVPFGLDAEARLAALRRTGAFDIVEGIARPWSLVLDADQTVALYRTYSNILLRPDRDSVLEQLGVIARGDFQGRVVRNMMTSLYIARRSGHAAAGFGGSAP